MAGPGAISAAADKLARQAARQAARDFTSQPLPEFRAMQETDGAPLSAAAVERHGVRLSEVEIASINCLVIDPAEVQGDRRIVYLFGGGFTVGSPTLDLPISAALAAHTGAQVICPYYPLAPEHPFPAARDACGKVSREILRQFPNTALVGESAGGNLALSVVHHLRASGGPTPCALALLSPAADLTGLGDSIKADRDPFLRAQDMGFFNGCYLPDDVALTDPGVSPIRGHFDTSFPATFITSGTRDMLLSTCVRLDRVMRDAGARVDLRVWEGMWHVFEYYPDLPEANASLVEISEFLESHFIVP